MKKLLLLLLLTLATNCFAQTTNPPGVIPITGTAPVITSWPTNGLIAGRAWTNTTSWDIEVVMTNQTATAVFNSSGTNVVPAIANPAAFSLPSNYWITNSAGAGFFYSSP